MALLPFGQLRGLVVAMLQSTCMLRYGKGNTSTLSLTQTSCRKTSTSSQINLAKPSKHLESYQRGDKSPLPIVALSLAIALKYALCCTRHQIIHCTSLSLCASFQQFFERFGHRAEFSTWCMRWSSPAVASIKYQTKLSGFNPVYSILLSF